MQANSLTLKDCADQGFPIAAHLQEEVASQSTHVLLALSKDGWLINAEERNPSAFQEWGAKKRVQDWDLPSARLVGRINRWKNYFRPKGKAKGFGKGKNYKGKSKTQIADMEEYLQLQAMLAPLRQEHVPTLDKGCTKGKGCLYKVKKR